MSSCLCGRNESCFVCDGTYAKDQELTKLRKALNEISDTALDAMAVAGVPSKALISIRWIRKLSETALGRDNDS